MQRGTHGYECRRIRNFCGQYQTTIAHSGRFRRGASTAKWSLATIGFFPSVWKRWLRSPKNTRLYSQEDVDRLRRIQEMTAELGMNLAGVERVFELEQQLEAMSRKLTSLERRARELKSEVERLENLRRELRAEIVPYERGGQLVRHSDLKRFRVPGSGA